MRKICFLIVLTAALTLFPTERDSVYFGYSDHGTYDVLTARLNFSQKDSLSTIFLTGNNTKTYYEKYSKEDFGINGDISVSFDFMRYGILLSSDYMSNSSVTRPTQSTVRILPLIGYKDRGLDLRTAFGYVGKSDEMAQKNGRMAVFEGMYSYKDESDNLLMRGLFDADDTDNNLNYSSNSSVLFSRDFDGSGQLSLNGRGSLSRYHFNDIRSDQYMIKRYEYDIMSVFSYTASQNLRNISEAGFYARNRDSYINGEFTGFNSNSDIKLGNETFFGSDLFSGGLRFDFDTGRDNFSVNYEEKDKSLSFYNFSISPRLNYRYSDFIFGITGRYLKHQYKSLTSSNIEDRDIIKISLSPEVTYLKSGSLTLTQSFPVEYYKLVNISSFRSMNNFTDRTVNSNTDLRLDLKRDLYLTGSVKFRTYYRSYDYDETYSSSFVIKNYSVSDTVSYNFSDRGGIKIATRYIYEEFGNFNFSRFTENPINFKHHYYSSASVSYSVFKGLFLRSEYFFYEIDSYDFDQDDFDKNELRRVYISHGPRLGLMYRGNGFSMSSGFEVENYRSSERQVKFRLESYLSFN